jgi:hypothetical protein
MICRGYTKEGKRCSNKMMYGIHCRKHYQELLGKVPDGCDDCGEAIDCDQLKKRWVHECKKRRGILWFRARGMTRLSKSSEP